MQRMMPIINDIFIFCFFCSIVAPYMSSNKNGTLSWFSNELTTRVAAAIIESYWPFPASITYRFLDTEGTSFLFVKNVITIDSKR